MKTAHEIISTIRDAGAEELQDILYTLEAGSVLAALGVTDADMEAVEEAHQLVRAQIDASTSTAKTTAERITKWVNAYKGRNVRIEWKWVGRDRSGVIELIEDGATLAKEVFSRGTFRWGVSDTDYTRCKTGSRKHTALRKVANAVGA